MNPTSYVHCNQIEKGHDFLRLRVGMLNLEPMGENPCVTTLLDCSPSLVSFNHHFNVLLLVRVVNASSGVWQDYHALPTCTLHQADPHASEENHYAMIPLSPQLHSL